MNGDCSKSRTLKRQEVEGRKIAEALAGLRGTDNGESS
jgi:hypothetical protein